MVIVLGELVQTTGREVDHPTDLIPKRSSGENGSTMTTSPMSPMLATLGRPPAPFTDFAVEAKYDGQRGIAVVEGAEVMLLSRNGAPAPSQR